MNFRFRRWRCAFQKIEVAAFVCLPDMFREQLAEATLVFAWIGLPLIAAFGEFFIADFERELSAGDVEFDDISGFDQSKWPADP